MALKRELFGKLEGELKLGLAGPTAALQRVTGLQVANIDPCATVALYSSIDPKATSFQQQKKRAGFE